MKMNKGYAIKTNLGYLKAIPRRGNYFHFTDEVENAGTYTLNVAKSALEKFSYPFVGPSDLAWRELKKVNKLEIMEVEIVYTTKQVHEEDFKLSVGKD